MRLITVRLPISIMTWLGLCTLLWAQQSLVTVGQDLGVEFEIPAGKVPYLQIRGKRNEGRSLRYGYIHEGSQNRFNDGYAFDSIFYGRDVALSFHPNGVIAAVTVEYVNPRRTVDLSAKKWRRCSAKYDDRGRLQSVSMYDMRRGQEKSSGVTYKGNPPRLDSIYETRGAATPDYKYDRRVKRRGSPPAGARMPRPLPDRPGFREVIARYGRQRTATILDPGLPSFPAELVRLGFGYDRGARRTLDELARHLKRLNPSIVEAEKKRQNLEDPEPSEGSGAALHDLLRIEPGFDTRNPPPAAYLFGDCRVDLPAGARWVAERRNSDWVKIRVGYKVGDDWVLKIDAEPGRVGPGENPMTYTGRVRFSCQGVASEAVYRRTGVLSFYRRDTWRDLDTRDPWRVGRQYVGYHYEGNQVDKVSNFEIQGSKVTQWDYRMRETWQIVRSLRDRSEISRRVVASIPAVPEFPLALRILGYHPRRWSGLDVYTLADAHRFLRRWDQRDLITRSSATRKRQGAAHAGRSGEGLPGGSSGPTPTAHSSRTERTGIHGRVESKRESAPKVASEEAKKQPSRLKLAGALRAIRRDPNNPEAHFNLGRAHMEARQYGKAWNAFARALLLAGQQGKPGSTYLRAMKEAVKAGRTAREQERTSLATERRRDSSSTSSGRSLSPERDADLRHRSTTAAAPNKDSPGAGRVPAGAGRAGAGREAHGHSAPSHQSRFTLLQLEQLLLGVNRTAQRLEIDGSIVSLGAIRESAERDHAPHDIPRLMLEEVVVSVLRANLERRGEWVDDETFAAAFAALRTLHSDGAFDLETIVVGFKGYPSLAVFKRRWRVQESFARTLPKAASERAALAAEVAASADLLGGTTINADLWFHEAPVSSDSRRAFGVAAERAERTRQALAEGRPAREGGARPESIEIRSKTFNQIRDALHENDFTSLFRSGVTESLFSAKAGHLVGPLRGTRGYYVARVTDRNTKAPRIDLDQERWKQLVHVLLVQRAFRKFVDASVRSASIKVVE